MKKYLFYLLLLLPLRGFSAIDHSDPDTSIVNRLNKLAVSFFRSDPDSALIYSNRSITLARKIHYLPGLANGLVQSGHVYYFKGNSTGAIKNFDEATLIYKQLRDQNGLSACYVQYARMYNQIGEYGKELEYLNMALEIDKHTGNEHALADCYKNIGIDYFSEGDLSKALDFYYKALFIAVKNHYIISSAEIYDDIGVVLQNMELFPNALEYFNKSVAVFTETRNLQAMGTMNENIANVLLEQEDYDDALGYLNKAYLFVRKQNQQGLLGSVYADFGLYYAGKKQERKAIIYLDSALIIGVKYNLSFEQAYALIGLAKVYNQLKDYPDSYTNAVQGHEIEEKLGNLSLKINATLQLYKALKGLKRLAAADRVLSEYFYQKDGLKNNESIQKLTSYNFKLNTMFEKHLIEEQQRGRDSLLMQQSRFQRFINTILIIIIVTLLVIIGVFYRQRLKQKRTNKLLTNRNLVVVRQKAELDEQANRLNGSNVLKNRLIAVLAHDLRAPLSTLTGLFDLLKDDDITHGELLEMIPPVLKQLKYTSDFLDTLLFWINSQMEDSDRTVKSFYVRELIVKETDNLNQQIAQKQISLIVNVNEDLVASADPDFVRIVIRNLITNAIKFCEEKDIIEVSARSQDKNILISVKDTGIGMPPEQFKRLFKGKVDSARGTKNESGTGMGLLFCKDLVEKCNGKISVTSRVGVGSEFSFTIPL